MYILCKLLGNCHQTNLIGVVMLYININYFLQSHIYVFIVTINIVLIT